MFFRRFRICFHDFDPNFFTKSGLPTAKSSPWMHCCQIARTRAKRASKYTGRCSDRTIVSRGDVRPWKAEDSDLFRRLQ